MKQTLQVVGGVALAGWTLLGGALWWSVAGHFDVVVDERVEGERDGTALLGERIDVLSADLDALIAALQGNFGVLAEALRDGDPDAAVARLEERLRHVEEALPAALTARETAGALSEVLARLESIPPPAGDAERALGRLEEPLAAVEEPAPAVDPAEPPPAVEPARSFLAFHLPERDFRFEGLQTFELLGDLCRVGFDAKSTLHDFTGLSQRVRGRFRVDPSRPTASIEGRIEIEAASLVTGLEGRDEALREHLAADDHPGIAFEPTAFEAASVDARARTIEGRVAGRMTVRGVTREVRMDVRAHVDDARRLVLEGEMPLSLGAFGVPVPEKLGLISMQDEVRVWISLLARARAEVAH